MSSTTLCIAPQIEILCLFCSLCTASIDKQLCHMAAGFEDSTVVLWSLNGYENYGRKPFQSFDDRLCQWSINNCNRILTDDLSDYESDEDVERNIETDCNESETENDRCSSSSSGFPRPSRRRKTGNKYKKRESIRVQWEKFAAKGCNENNL